MSIFWFVILALFELIHTKSVKLTPVEKQTLVDMHNKARSVTGRGQMDCFGGKCPPSDELLKAKVVWNEALAAVAAGEYNCVFGHRENPARDLQKVCAKNSACPVEKQKINTIRWVGENIYMSSSAWDINKYTQSMYELMVIKEAKTWKFTEKYVGGSWGHYTQIIFQKTDKIGCARHTCKDGDHVFCNYWPGGNILGTKTYQKNLKPTPPTKYPTKKPTSPTKKPVVKPTSKNPSGPSNPGNPNNPNGGWIPIGPWQPWSPNNSPNNPWSNFPWLPNNSPNKPPSNSPACEDIVINQKYSKYSFAFYGNSKQVNYCIKKSISDKISKVILKVEFVATDYDSNSGTDNYFEFGFKNGNSRKFSKPGHKKLCNQGQKFYDPKPIEFVPSGIWSNSNPIKLFFKNGPQVKPLCNGISLEFTAHLTFVWK